MASDQLGLDDFVLGCDFVEMLSSLSDVFILSAQPDGKKMSLNAGKLMENLRTQLGDKYTPSQYSAIQRMLEGYLGISTRRQPYQSTFSGLLGQGAGLDTAGFEREVE